jgi:hypothetical protein
MARANVSFRAVKYYLWMKNFSPCLCYFHIQYTNKHFPGPLLPFSQVTGFSSKNRPYLIRNGGLSESSFLKVNYVYGKPFKCIKMDDLCDMNLESFKLWSFHALKIYLSKRNLDVNSMFYELSARRLVV